VRQYGIKKSKMTPVENNCELFGDTLVHNGPDFEKGSIRSAKGSIQF
jgi:hypothetical protein